MKARVYPFMGKNIKKILFTISCKQRSIYLIGKLIFCVLSSVVLKQEEEPVVVTYTHMFDTCTQDWFAVASILENHLLTLKMKTHHSARPS